MSTEDRLRHRTLGPHGPAVTPVALGTSPLGGMPHIYGYDVDETTAIDTVTAFLESSLNFIDTSNDYGAGESERRIGVALREAITPRDDLVIATKADPAPGSRDFSAERIRTSFKESTARLGVNYIDVFYLHDPERFAFESVTAPGGALDAAIALRESGHVGMIGVAGGDIDQMRRYIDTGKLDVLLNHSQFNLIDRTASSLIDHAVAAGIPFINAAPYASGILAKGAATQARYRYRPAGAAVTRAVAHLEDAARNHGVPLAALALQFSTRDPRIASTVVGASSPSRVAALISNQQLAIPDELWNEVIELSLDEQ
ncbi:D-threo-aldose 1-dehydrogenase [Microbacterium sp. cf046]|uniref:aldo/keto reductase n=1 Tax=Microbacterium sp. cf046 TaxID=1761803 RepID=UPI0008E11685|nr:aldo/keto reductase [Microbacterium sp. cf046]SFS16954.1 D-threo-aldose 1-dehydrogenase [Microbacterium sp. cf046]